MATHKFVELGRVGGRARASKLSPAERSAIASKAARARWGGVAGITRDGVVPIAVLRAGLHVDAPHPTTLPSNDKGLVDMDQAIMEVVSLREAQVGPKAAAATIRRCEGRWLGGPAEPTVECEIAFVPVPKYEADSRTFRAHMENLAEELAGRLGQQETQLWFGNELIRASAPGAPPPPPRPR